MKFEIVEGVTIEVSEDDVCCKVINAIQAVDAYCEALVAMPYKEVSGYSAVHSAITEVLDASYYEAEFKPYRDMVWKAYCKLDDCEDEAYRRYAEADFLEYASHKDEPSFDWDFYSDWHKDLYGFRPRG